MTPRHRLEKGLPLEGKAEIRVAHVQCSDFLGALGFLGAFSFLDILKFHL